MMVLFTLLVRNNDVFYDYLWLSNDYFVMNVTRSLSVVDLELMPS